MSNNTCKPSSLRARLERQLASLKAHLENNPKDKMTAARINVIEAQLSELN